MNLEVFQSIGSWLSEHPKTVGFAIGFGLMLLVDILVIAALINQICKDEKPAFERDNQEK